MAGKNTPARVREMRDWIVKNDASFNLAGKHFGLSPTTIMYAVNESKAAREMGQWGRGPTIASDKKVTPSKPNFIDITPAKQSSQVAIVICSPDQVKDLIQSLT